LTEEVESQVPTHRAVVFTPELVVRQSTGPAGTS
jgi:LacI family transcriptional regulator